MSKKCKAYSQATNGTEPEGFKEGFYACWEIRDQLERSRYPGLLKRLDKMWRQADTKVHEAKKKMDKIDNWGGSWALHKKDYDAYGWMCEELKKIFKAF
jgi:hypothetical protein